MKTKFFVCSPILTLKNSIRLRKEHFGGIIFDQMKGTVVEVDKEAFIMLSIIQSLGPIREEEVCESLREKGVGANDIHDVISKLLELEILVDCSNEPISQKESLLSTDFHSIHWPTPPSLTAPETIHWAVTYRCNSFCPDCYVSRYSQQFPTELDSAKACQVIDILADWGVFQLAIGGGEPLLRPDITQITNYAYQKDMVVHITTGVSNIENKLLGELAKSITFLQLGIKHETLLLEPTNELANLSKCVKVAEKLNLRVGANLMLSNTVINNFETLVNYLTQAGLTRVTLLRYKPPTSKARWNKENPSKPALLGFEQFFPQMMNKYPTITFRVDCALSFLQRSLSPSDALSSGIRGCTAADRILALAPDGSIFPCSQLVSPDLRCGNILKDPIRELWADNKILKRYRSFRDQLSFQQGLCGTCKAKNHCGGCRVFAHDISDADLGCPAGEPERIL